MLKGLLFSVILCSQVLASGPFTHPDKGYFSFQPPSRDPWYWVENGGSPDKWEHYMGNYAGGLILKNRVGTVKTIVLLSTVNFLKEWGDGYREGFSVRDMGANTLGLLASLLNQKLLCNYDIRQRRIILTYYFNASL